MIETEEMYTIEYEVLGSSLSMLDEKDELRIGAILPNKSFTVDNFRSHYSVSEEVYIEACKNLFVNTKDRFDWGEMMKRAVGQRTYTVVNNVVKTIPEKSFTGDPLDLQFMKYARKINELILRQKSPTYKDSWRKRGLVGIYHNLCRKWDRIENIIEHNNDGRELSPNSMATDGEALVDAIADMFAYCGKTMTYFEHMDIYIDVLSRWEEKNGVEDIK